MYKKSCTFVLGLSKEVLSPINLLVISFSVINYVVRVRVHAGCVDAHFFVFSPTLIHGKAVPVDKLGKTGRPSTEKAVLVDKPGLHQGDSALGLPPHLPNRRTIRKFAGRNIR